MNLGAVMGLLCVALSANAATAQDKGHIVLSKGKPVLQFTTGTGDDVVVRREGDTLLFDVFTAHYVNGKGGDMCIGTFAISRTNLTFRPDRSGPNAGKCRKLAQHEPSLAALRDARISRGSRNTPGRPTLGVEFKADDTEYIAWLPQLLKCEDCEIAPYEYLLLALTVPDSALARFDMTTSGKPVPVGQAQSEPEKLYEQFFNQRRTDPDAAYATARVYLERMKGEPPSPEIEFARQWVAAYEKVKRPQ